MRNVFLFIFCIAAMFPVIGCSESAEQGTVVTTDEEEILAYEKMIDEGEGEDEIPE